MFAKGNTRNPCGDETILYLDYLHANNLSVILHISFAGCYHWKELGKGYTGTLLFLTTAHESTIISK